jgi:predicted DNA-binding protein (UPF0251 family)
MGVSKFDTEAGDRKFTAKYPALDSADGLRILFSDLHALRQRQYHGDYDATVILIDLASAIKAAELTARQAEALALVYDEDLTQASAGLRLGIAQNTLSEAVDRALEAIAEVYWYWARHGEGYAVISDMGETE